MKNLKVLCICNVGMNRSKYLAGYLKRKEYATRFGGINYRKDEPHNPIRQEDVDWADIIILVRERLKPMLKGLFKVKNKRLIILDVTDSANRIPDSHSHLRELDKGEFNRKWTYPQLRKAIKEYLPLKKK